MKYSETYQILEEGEDSSGQTMAASMTRQTIGRKASVYAAKHDFRWQFIGSILRTLFPGLKLTK